MANYYDTWHQNFWLDTVWPEEFWYSDDATYSGTISQSLAALTPAFSGSSTEPGAVTGTIAATLGPLTSNLPGTTATLIVFDIPINLSVNWQVLDLSIRSGTVAETLDDISASFSGIAWENSYTNGVIESQSLFWPAMFWGNVWTPEYWLTAPSLEGVSANFDGFLAEPGDYVGVLAGALGNLSSTILGSIYAPANFNGRISSVLGELSSAMSGTHVDPIQTGSIAGTLDNVTGLIQALSIEAGSIVGQVRSTLDNVNAFECYGQVYVSPRTAVMPALLEDLSGSIVGLSLPDGARFGPLTAFLSGVGAVFAGTNESPRARARSDVPQVSEIDWKTLCDQHNAGLPRDPDYEFSNNRRFYQG